MEEKNLLAWRIPKTISVSGQQMERKESMAESAEERGNKLTVNRKEIIGREEVGSEEQTEWKTS